MSDANALPPEGLAPPVAADDRLHSWKEIAAYLKRDIRTVQRWEKLESLPVRRHQHQKRGSAFAYRDELDAWWRTRGYEVDDATLPVDADQAPVDAGTQGADALPVAILAPETRRVQGALPWIVTGIALAVAAFSYAARHPSTRTEPPVQRFQLLAPPEHSLTPALGLALSPDGQRLAFVSHDRA